jgi:hypothetical protein
VDWIRLAEDSDQLLAVVKTAGNFLTICVTVRLLKRTLHHEVSWYHLDPL